MTSQYGISPDTDSSIWYISFLLCGPDDEMYLHDQYDQAPCMNECNWLHCTMCILGTTMALWSKAEIQKYTF